MKKILFTGIVMILVMMFVVTCDEPVKEEVEYTDVVYSPDGSEITLYIDGVGVPVTPAQRAINREMAMMAYDYFEVIFVGANTAAGTARTAWELGSPAAISAVPRGVNYAFAATPTTNAAAMFVGRKDSKTLLGVGVLTGTKGATTPTTPTTVETDTTSVTFSISAIETGLLVGTETADPGTGGTLPGTAIAGVMRDSFVYTTGGTVTTAPTKSTATRQILGGISYPKYILPEDDGKTVNAQYTFYLRNGGNDPVGYIKHINDSANNITPQVLKRVPRFIQSGKYREPGDRWTTLTKVALNPTTYGADNTPFTAAVPIQFTLRGTGIFSFYIQIPVYLLTKNTASFTGGTGYTAAETWYIRSGLGSELYSLDDGMSNGGCVYMQVGTASTSNMIDIDWNWLP